MTRRIGILGGTFDPPHIGHLSLAVHARDQLDLDEVQLIVAHDPWQKSGDRAITAAQHRLAMTEAAVAGFRGLRASGVEIGRGGPSYTIDTVEALEGPDVALVLIVGADAAAGLPSWHRADELSRRAEVAVAPRPGTPAIDVEGWQVTAFQTPLIEISSSELRERAYANESLDVLVPASVVNYIVGHGLYSR